MTAGNNASDALCESIVNGTFPQSEDLLTSDLSSELIPQLLSQISGTRRQISDEIRAVSKDDSGDVAQWISHARKAQEDIARCKLESQRIVEEHEQVQALREQAVDYQRKVELLESEIDFTETLKRELQKVSAATQSLREVEDCLGRQDPCTPAQKLEELDAATSHILKSRTSTLVRDLKDELRLKTLVQLENQLHNQITVKKEQQKVTVEASPTETDADLTNSATLLQALDRLGDPHGSVEPLLDKLRTFVLQPLRQSSRLKLATYDVSQRGIHIQLNKDGAALEAVFSFILDFIRFLHSSLSGALQSVIVKAILPDMMTILVLDWLNPSLPTELPMFGELDVNRILEEMKAHRWQGQKELQDWVDDIPRAWLNKRKAATLDAVRKAFASSKGVLRQVERVERQVVATAEVTQGQPQDDANDDWDANWDDNNKGSSTGPNPGKAEDEDEVSAWGFDDEEDRTKDEGGHAVSKPTGSTEEEGDPEDAWGWGDDSPEETKEDSKPHSSPKQDAGDRAQQPPSSKQEVTLTEVYSISDIPDQIVDIIERDAKDAQTLLEAGTQQHQSLDSSTASRGLLALPTLALAMFRAVAPSYYGASPTLTDLHRYNDSLYIAERLRDSMETTAGTARPPSLDSDIKAMERFARLAYSKEMETQRLIIWDLLEGAQGFVACTQFPYSQEIENAVSAVVDRIRTLHRLWKPVLSTSALMQSIGSLLTMVIAKVISSIEDMDDISEPESQRLTALCQQIASLDDLFLSNAPRDVKEEGGEGGGAESVPMTAVYVSNWLRFQYLINILESSLVDIKYLWTEGELSLEFSEDEVVDLIKALFAESSHRRNAIAAIRGSRRSR
ncbi:ribosome biogenesis protein ytm1 [Exophiala dermatitidis]|nr:ribosome biogenesis protein ytm1 [Exophiala dermatitidis]